MRMSITREFEANMVRAREAKREQRLTAHEEMIREAQREAVARERTKGERREIFGFPAIDTQTAFLADALQAIAERGARQGTEQTWVLFNRVMDLYVWSYEEAKEGR